MIRRRWLHRCWRFHPLRLGRLVHRSFGQCSPLQLLSLIHPTAPGHSRPVARRGSPPLRSDRGCPDPHTNYVAADADVPQPSNTSSLAGVVSSSKNRARIRLVASSTITINTHGSRRPSNQSWCEPSSCTIAPKLGLRSRHCRCFCRRRPPRPLPVLQQPPPQRLVIHHQPFPDQMLRHQRRSKVGVPTTPLAQLNLPRASGIFFQL